MASMTLCEHFFFKVALANFFRINSAPRCFMPSFKILGLLDLKKILKVFTIYGCDDHLGNVTWTWFSLSKRFIEEDFVRMEMTDGRQRKGIL